MTFSNLEVATQIFESMVISIGVVIGGIWSYYKFVKGRLFAPRIELSLDTSTLEIDESDYLVICQAKLSNIGSVQIRPENCNISAINHQSKSLLDSTDILPFDSPITEGFYYIDPMESSYRTHMFRVDRKEKLCIIELSAAYNKNRFTSKTFVCVLDDPVKVDGKAPNNQIDQGLS
ncbi:MAG: hypothetical protein DHS20C12_06090 [Pseudohongiella sp.]|nr:MAG: hypothetical protein DHS20C12_06090 [Pseudohongiella sp.]